MADPDVSQKSPLELLGGEARVRELAERFYDAMEREEPALTRLHRLDDSGKVSRESRERFGMFLVGWLGGPQRYIETHGHPRLRMRHAQVSIDEAMRDAWLRSMKRALDALGIDGDVRRFLDARFLEVADFLRNVEEQGPAANPTSGLGILPREPK